MGIKGNGNTNYPSGSYKYAHINISQNHTEVLYRFQNAVGLGTVRGPVEYKDKSLPMYYYQVTKQADVIKVRELISPYLSSKKLDQFKHVFDLVHGVKKYNNLTEEIVLDIRSRYAAGGISMRALAYEYDTVTSHVSNIINRRTWTNV